MGKDYFKDSGIPPTYNVDHPEMAIWNSFFSAQELNFSSEKDCFTEPNYNCLTSQQSHHFGSSLNSMVSSGVPNDTFLLHKLIGNSGNLSQMVNYDLPNCPNSESLTHVYPPLVADQGFIERAAKFSCFLGNNSLGCNEAENTVSGAKPANSNEKSSVSELVKSCRKRKTFSQENSKVDMVEKADEIDNAKRSKAKEENWKVHSGGKKEKETKSGNDTSGEDESGNQEKGNQNTPEPPKDYIHVRARRGQATDSHSLAERVRREKISERMKLLEDLVPGCNKVTGKALMLDEIINYVQALQHQVEFLSMKLASVNTGMSSAGDSLVPKPMFQPNALYSSHPQQAPQQLKNYASTGSVSQFPMNPMDRSTGLGMPLPPSDRFGEGPPQVVNRCEGDLQSIVQRAISHDGQNALHSLGFLSQNQVASMKIEL